MPLAMEHYAAEDVLPVDKCLRDVAGTNVYLGIFAWRYGFIPNGYSRSITELEYRKAKEKKIPTLIFLTKENVKGLESNIDHDDDTRRIRAFREELKNEKVVSFFTSPEDLRAEVATAVALHAPAVRPISGDWRPEAVTVFKDRREAVSQLRAMLRDRSIRLISIVGRGGIGKTWLLSKICLEIETGQLRLTDAPSAMGADAIVYVSCRGQETQASSGGSTGWRTLWGPPTHRPWQNVGATHRGPCPRRSMSCLP